MSLTSKDIESKLDGIDAKSFKSEGERAQARLVVAKALSRIETPWETGTNVVWSHVRQLHLCTASHELIFA